MTENEVHRDFAEKFATAASRIMLRVDDHIQNGDYNHQQVMELIATANATANIGVLHATLANYIAPLSTDMEKFDD